MADILSENTISVIKQLLSERRKYRDFKAMEHCTAGDRHCRGIEDFVERIQRKGDVDYDSKYGSRDKGKVIKIFSDALTGKEDGEYETWDGYFGTSGFQVRGPIDKNPALNKLLALLIRRGVRRAKENDPNRGSWNEDEPGSKTGQFVDLSKDQYELYVWLRNKMGHTANLSKHRWDTNDGNDY